MHTVVATFQKVNKAEVQLPSCRPPNIENLSTLRVENTLIKGVSGFLSVTDVSFSDANSPSMTTFRFNCYFQFLSNLFFFFWVVYFFIIQCVSKRWTQIHTACISNQVYHFATLHNPVVHIIIIPLGKNKIKISNNFPSLLLQLDQHSCSFQKSFLAFFFLWRWKPVFIGFPGILWGQWK